MRWTQLFRDPVVDPEPIGQPWVHEARRDERAAPAEARHAPDGRPQPGAAPASAPAPLGAADD